MAMLAGMNLLTKKSGIMKIQLRLIAITCVAALVSSCSQYQVKSAQNLDPADRHLWSGYPHAGPQIPLAETVRL